MLKEFKEFALKGNIMDMAVGVVIGGAFQKIVNSLVNDIIMPVIAIFHVLVIVAVPLIVNVCANAAYPTAIIATAASNVPITTFLPLFVLIIYLL